MIVVGALLWCRLYARIMAEMVDVAEAWRTWTQTLNLMMVMKIMNSTRKMKASELPATMGCDETWSLQARYDWCGDNKVLLMENLENCMRALNQHQLMKSVGVTLLEKMRNARLPLSGRLLFASLLGVRAN